MLIVVLKQVREHQHPSADIHLCGVVYRYGCHCCCIPLRTYGQEKFVMGGCNLVCLLRSALRQVTQVVGEMVEIMREGRIIHDNDLRF
jgi:hypothetical protein